MKTVPRKPGTGVANKDSWLSSTECKLVDGRSTQENNKRGFRDKPIVITRRSSKALPTNVGSAAFHAGRSLRGQRSSGKDWRGSGHHQGNVRATVDDATSSSVYRAPASSGPAPRDLRPAPAFEARIAPRNVSLQQALPVANTDGVTISPDGRSLNIPLR